MNINSIKQRLTVIPSEVEHKFFQIQGSKFKHDPFCGLIQASVRSISHAALTEWYAADLNADGRLDAADLTLLKKMIVF